MMNNTGEKKFAFPYGNEGNNLIVHIGKSYYTATKSINIFVLYLLEIKILRG